MGKRKKEYQNSKIRRKIRRLEQKLRFSSSTSEDEEYHRYDSRSRSLEPAPVNSHSEVSDDDYQIRSCVISPPAQPGTSTSNVNECELPPPQSGPSTSDAPDAASSESLPPEILEALGDPMGKEEILGPPINEEIAKRWGRVLVEGMTKDIKEAITKKTLFPENFSISKAPKLNLEISTALSESIKHRDKLLEKAQNQLGLGIAGLTNLASLLIKDDLAEVEILKKLSDTSQIFLDLHYENTKHRRKLITTSLDKKFNAAIIDVKRDEFLFGVDLGVKIKATKTAEKSGLQIKRKIMSAASSSRQQVNWKGPLRFQSNRAPKPGGQKTKYSNNQGWANTAQQRRRQPATNRPLPSPRTDTGPRMSR